MKNITVIIPVKYSDIDYVLKSIKYIKKNILPEKIVIITSKKNLNIDIIETSDLEILDEDEILKDLNLSSVKKYMALCKLDQNAAGWFLQQFIKYAYAYICNSEYYLSWDADMIPLRKMIFFDQDTGKPFFTLKKEYVSRYFYTIQRLLGIKKQIKESFIAEHMVFKKEFVLELIEKINSSNNAGNNFWQKIINSMLPTEDVYAFSEFETYGNYIFANHYDSYKTRKLNMLRHAKYFLGDNPDNNTLKWVSKSFDTVSFEHFDKAICSTLFLNKLVQKIVAFDRLLKIVYKFLEKKYQKNLSEFDYFFGDKLAYEEDINNSKDNFNRKRHLFVDIGSLAEFDHKTGTERVVRGLSNALLNSKNLYYTIHLVYSTSENTFNYAHTYTKEKFNIDDGFNDSTQISYQKGDIYFCPHLDLHKTISMQDTLRDMNSEGVHIGFILYDLIPIVYKNLPPSTFAEIFPKYLDVVLESDFIVCDSKQVEADLAKYILENCPKKLQHITLSHIPLGYDIDQTLPTKGLNDDNIKCLETLSRGKTFCSISTIDKRKMQTQILNAFELLWNYNYDVNLVFVGKSGFDMDILIHRIKTHQEYNKRLFFLESISDEYLNKVYEASDCLIMASVAEGFGLPIIEAASKGLSLLLRELPVFREIAGDNAIYFTGLLDNDLAKAVAKWIELDANKKLPSVDNIKLYTWKEVADNFLQQLTFKLLNKKIHSKHICKIKNFHVEQNNKIKLSSLERIFSIKNQYGVGKKHKVITIMGIKFKIRM